MALKLNSYSAILALILAGNCLADDMDMDALSKELVNPIGMKWKLNNYIEIAQMGGDASNSNKTATVWNIQPVMPVMLNNGSGFTLMNRPALPVFLNKPMPMNNGINQDNDFDRVSGIGDLTLQSSLGKMPKTSWGSYMWGAGLSLTLPTATDDALGAEKYAAGPTAMLVGFTENMTFGLVAAHEWSFAGNDDRDDINRSMLQFIYYKQLGGGWQIGDNPQWSADWDSLSGQKYTMPIGLGLFKTLKIADSPWRLGITPRYYLKSNEHWGNDWSITFTVTAVINSPITM